MVGGLYGGSLWCEVCMEGVCGVRFVWRGSVV